MDACTFDFRGSAVVVAGASGTLGRAVALAFAGAGANLALVSRNADSVRAALPELSTAATTLVATSTDLNDPDAAQMMVGASDAAAAIHGALIPAYGLS